MTNQNMSDTQEQRRENDIDAAATLLGFRTTLAAEQQVQESAMTTAPSLHEQSHQQQLEQYQHQHQQARLPPKKRRSKTLGRALPLSQRPIPAAVLQAAPPAAALPSSASASALASIPTPAPTPASMRPKISRFPQRLIEMLADETITDSISWLPHGRSFLVHNPAKFTDEVLPKYFGACKFASFTRKLYRWGFRQISKGPDQDSFFHKNFRRDEPELCDEMICKEEIRDGCPELHGGINAYSLMRMEQADRLQELMKKNLDTKKKLDMARAIKLREQYPQAPANVAQQQPEMTSAAAATATSAVDLTGSPSPQLPGGVVAAAHPTNATNAAAGLSHLPEGGGIGLVQRQLLRIEQRRSELQAVLREEIVKRRAIADSKRRYTQLLAHHHQQQQQQTPQEQQQQYYQEPPRPDRADTVAESKRRYAELLMARRDRLASGLTSAVQAQMHASPAMAPAPTPTTDGTHAIRAIHHHQLHHPQAVHDQEKKAAAEDVAITGTFYPSLTKHHQQQTPSTEPLKSCLKKSSPYSSATAPPPFPGYSLLAKHHQHHADLLARYPHHGHHQAALHHPSPHSARTLAILRASLEQQRKEELLGGAPVGGAEGAPSATANGAVSPSDKNAVAAGVINRALETLRREGFA